MPRFWRNNGPLAASLIPRLKLPQPRRNMRKKVRLFAMGAGQGGDVAWQAGKALSVQIDIGIDQVSSRGHTNFSTGIPICSLWAWEGEGG